MEIKLNEARCTGCRACELVCALFHFQENNPRKARLRINGKFPSPGAYQVNFCTQCGICKEVCPVEAVYERDGVYIIDPESCIRCFACVSECPQNAIFITNETESPIKCDLCMECVELCPREVIAITR